MPDRRSHTSRIIRSSKRQLNAQLAHNGYIVPQNDSNLAAPLLAQSRSAARCLTAFVSAVAFATILAVVAGLTITASSAFAHDIWFSLVRNGTRRRNRTPLRRPRGRVASSASLAIVLSIALRGFNVAFLVGLAFAVAASANVPVILLALSWRRFSRTGAIAGMLSGLVSSLALIAVEPRAHGRARDLSARKPRDRLDSDRLRPARFSGRCSRATANPRRCSINCKFAQPDRREV